MGLCPAEVEYKLAPGMGLAVHRCGGQQPFTVEEREMRGNPARTAAHAAAVFQRGEEFMAQEGTLAARKPVPAGRVDAIDARQFPDFHALPR